MSSAPDIIRRLKKMGDPAVAASSLRFFKTGPGEYGEGDVFIGLRVPELRRLARAYEAIDTDDLRRLLRDPHHEIRMLALLIMVRQFAASGRDGERQELYRLYLRHTGFINNWDLVDCSSEHIVGGYLFPRDRKPLYRLAASSSLWERRIAIMATFHFVKRNDFTDTLALAERLLDDREDLIHKAAGWMLRETGRRDRNTAAAFLDRHAPVMPRTMLRYAIEHLPEGERNRYMAMKRRSR